MPINSLAHQYDTIVLPDSERSEPVCNLTRVVVSDGIVASISGTGMNAVALRCGFAHAIRAKTSMVDDVVAHSPPSSIACNRSVHCSCLVCGLVSMVILLILIIVAYTYSSRDASVWEYWASPSHRDEDIQYTRRPFARCSRAQFYTPLRDNENVRAVQKWLLSLLTYNCQQMMIESPTASVPWWTHG